MTPSLHPSSDRAAVDAAVALRIAVFVDEQGVPLAEEVDAHDAPDAASVHALVRDAAGTALATGRLVRDDERTARIGRMAVAAHARGGGAGMAVLRALMDEAHARGYHEAVLSAQTHARAFYERAGFIAEGAEYDDCGIPHITMRAALGNPSSS